MAMTYGRVAISRRVVVNLLDGTAIEGVLWEDRRPLLVLRAAKVHQAGQQLPLDGDVLIEYSRVSFVQAV